MKAVIVKEFGNANVLEINERPSPKVKENEVLIKVAAAGLNRADIAQRKGNYPAPKNSVQDVLGLEVSGTIEEIDSKVTQWKVGDEVCALLPGGGYAEYVAVDSGSCLPIPKNFSLIDAASIPEVLLTVWQNIFQIGRLQPKEKVLIYGGSGGIGSMAIQLTNLFGAHPVTLASSKQKIGYCAGLGVKQVIDYTCEDLVEEFGKNSIDLILDSVGGEYLNQNLDLLKKDGRLVYINAMGGNGKLNIFKMMQKRIHITGSTLRARSLAHKKQLVQEAVEKAYPLIESDKFQNTVSKTFPVEEVVKAHELMESREFLGKILLTF